MVFASVIFLGFVFLYSFGVSASVFGGDAGDIMLSYFFGGIAHPPGYPLNTMLGYVFSRILPGETFAFRADFVSALYQAFSVAVLFLILARITRNFAVSIAGSMLMGILPLFWLYAHIAEVFQLTILLNLLSIYFLFDWYFDSKKNNFRPLFLSFVFYSLSVFHHQIPLFWLPAYLYLVSKRKKEIFKLKKTVILSILCLSAGSLPYIYSVIASILGVATNWGDASSLSGFWQLISRSDYGTFAAAGELVGIPLRVRADQILWYLNTAKADFSLFGVALATFGGFFLLVKKRELFWFLTVAWVFSGPFFIAYAAFPPSEAFLRGVSERFFLQSYPFLAIFSAFGMLVVFNFLTNIFSVILKRKQLVHLTCGIILLFFPLTYGFINIVKADLSDFRAGEVLGVDILNGAEPAGILFLQGDTITFAVQYLYYAEKRNNDSMLVMSGRMRHQSYRKKLVKEYPTLLYPDGFTSNSISFEDSVVKFIELNFNKFPIYSLEKLPLEDKYSWVQEGTVLRLYETGSKPGEKEVQDRIEKKMANLAFESEVTKKRYLNFFEEHIRGIYARFYSRNGFELMAQNANEPAMKYFGEALILESDNLEALYGFGVSGLEMSNCNNAKEAFLKIVKLREDYWQAYEGLAQVASKCDKDEVKKQQYLDKSLEIRKKLSSTPIN